MREHWRFTPTGRDALSRLPPITGINARIDPLRSETIADGEALRAAGVAIEMMNCDAVADEFFGTGAVAPQAVVATEFATAQ